MASKEFPNLPGKERPEMVSDRVGKPSHFGDQDWKQVKHLYKRLPNGNWVRK